MKAVRWVMLAAVVCALGLCTGYKAGATVTLTVKVEAQLEYNHHVGDDWSNTYSVVYNGKTHTCKSDGEMSFSYKLGDELEIRTNIVERDSVDDCASYSSYVSLSASDVRYGVGYRQTHSVVVTENRGRYAGNAAEWEVWYTFYSDQPAAATPTLAPTKKPSISNGTAYNRDLLDVGGAVAATPERTLPPSPSKTATPVVSDVEAAEGDAEVEKVEPSTSSVDAGKKKTTVTILLIFGIALVMAAVQMAELKKEMRRK